MQFQTLLHSRPPPLVNFTAQLASRAPSPLVKRRTGLGRPCRRRPSPLPPSGRLTGPPLTRAPHTDLWGIEQAARNGGGGGGSSGRPVRVYVVPAGDRLPSSPSFLPAALLGRRRPLRRPLSALAAAALLLVQARYEYRWADGVQIKKPIEVSTPKYVEYLMDWIEGQLDDESIFPQKLGIPFPPNFKEIVKTIFKRLFRIYVHIHHSHFQKIVSLKEEAHLNTCFKHFILFTNEFGLIDKKELASLHELIESIIVPY
ncbi:hypothetical protein PAHAL_1G062400 [Panicum hallii]|uniref:MOB kinase activator-like 1A n=1 Tax=Panicum hallii TaxID=206008 RepID=A0A2S3GM97_9POAL|nr:hypothetical protein PAHAL_1G062400 [Panicum hallii]